MQGDDRLAGPGTPGHDERPGRRRPDDPVLVGLDRRDDVSHALTVRALERREQRPLSGRRLEAESLRRRRIDQLVHDVDDARAISEDRPAARDPLGVRSGRAVEGRCGGCAPVDEEHVVVIDDRHATDRERVAVLQVETPEQQRLTVTDGEAGDAPRLVMGDHVALELGGERRAEA